MKDSWLILFRKNIARYFENHKEHVNIARVCKMRGILMLKQVVRIVTTGL